MLHEEEDIYAHDCILYLTDSMINIYNNWSYNLDKLAHCILGSKKTILYESPR